MTAGLTDLRFHAITLTVAAVAAIATFGTTNAMLLPPAMFLGWVAFSLGAPSMRHGFANLASFEAGLLFGIGTALATAFLTPSLGTLAGPTAVAGVVVLVLSLRTHAPFNNPLAYFLGVTSFFYSGLAPSASALVMLGAAGAIGAASSALAGILEGWIHRLAEGKATAAVAN